VAEEQGRGMRKEPVLVLVQVRVLVVPVLSLLVRVQV
jgi:hypothetical protein